MKNFNLLILAVIFGFAGCQSAKMPDGVEVLSANYQVMTSGSFEKGYVFTMQCRALPEQMSISGVIINHRLFNDLKVEQDKKSGKINIEQYLTVESRKIQGFQAPPFDARRDGIVFEKDGKEYYLYYPFQLIE